MRIDSLSSLPEALIKKNEKKLRDAFLNDSNSKKIGLDSGTHFILEKEKKQKHNNVCSWFDGCFFRSNKELKFYKDVKLLFRAGEITGFVLQPKFILQEGTDKDNKAITYKADFLLLYPDGTYKVIDTKGMETKDWIRTYKMFKKRYPEVKLEVVK